MSIKNVLFGFLSKKISMFDYHFEGTYIIYVVRINGHTACYIRKELNRMARRGDNIHKRKDGRWEGRYKNGYRSDGSVKYSSVYASTHSDCKRKLILAQSNTEKVEKTLRHDKLFSDLLRTWMYSNRVRIKGATEAKYSRLIESHIIPAIGGLKACQIDSSTVNNFLDSKLKTGGLKNKDALSPSYVRTMAVIIEAALNYAVMEGICNPLRTPINKPSVPKKDIKILSKQAEIALTEKLSCDSSLVSIGILLALQGGLRIGEVCALRWTDVDFEKGLIHVRHTVTRVPCPNSEQKTMLIIDTPKTISSIRDVPMPSTLHYILLRAYQNRTSEFVVSSSHSFVSTRTFDYQYRKLLKQHEIQPFCFHTLRHTYATRCAESGMDAKTLSQLLGHSSSNITLNIYVHPSMEVATNLLEHIFCTA